MSTLEQIRAKMKKLQKQADALIARQAQKVVDQIRTLMIEHGLTTADIEAAAKRRRQRAGKASVTTSAKKTMPPKYRDPKTGDTWSGYGRAPAWIANAKDRSRFLIDVATTKAVSRSKAMYRDPVTGKTWTGRGRAPAWIAQAKDRAVFLIAKSGEGKAKPAAKKGAAKKAAIKRASAKPASAKAVGTKTAGAKTTRAKTASARTTSARAAHAANAPFATKRAIKTPSANKIPATALAAAQAVIDSIASSSDGSQVSVA
ncbi:putative regulator [Candidatus Burkholderia humilis]|nr:putative regulator [Candidatus Burkholderia humilis]